MKILVTGGAGFIGSTIVDRYIEEGHSVVVVDNESSGKRAQVNKKAVFVRLDVRDRKKVGQLVHKHRFHVINHHAAQIDVRHSVADPHHDAHVNIMGTLNLLEAAQTSKVKKFIFSASGGTAYGNCSRPAREGDPEVPLSPYGVTKLAGEKYIQTFSSLYGFKFTIFRYANVYGPRQDPHGEAGVVAIFSNKLLGNESPFIFGTGRQTRDYVFVGDVAHANVLALSKGDNQTLNIGTGIETSVLALWNKMASIRGASPRLIYKPLRPGELQRSVLSYSKAKKELGWAPSTRLKEGLSATLSFFEEKRQAVSR